MDSTPEFNAICSPRWNQSFISNWMPLSILTRIPPIKVPFNSVEASTCTCVSRPLTSLLSSISTSWKWSKSSVIYCSLHKNVFLSAWQTSYMAQKEPNAKCPELWSQAFIPWYWYLITSLVKVLQIQVPVVNMEQFLHPLHSFHGILSHKETDTCALNKSFLLNSNWAIEYSVPLLTTWKYNKKLRLFSSGDHEISHDKWGKKALYPSKIGQISWRPD